MTAQVGGRVAFAPAYERLLDTVEDAGGGLTVVRLAVKLVRLGVRLVSLSVGLAVEILGGEGAQLLRQVGQQTRPRPPLQRGELLRLVASCKYFPFFKNEKYLQRATRRRSSPRWSGGRGRVFLDSRHFRLDTSFLDSRVWHVSNLAPEHV